MTSSSATSMSASAPNQETTAPGNTVETMEGNKEEEEKGETTTTDDAVTTATTAPSSSELSLSQYVHQELMKLWRDPAAIPRLKPFLQQLDAFLVFGGGSPSSCQLPPIDWKLFRKSYSVLMWIKPVMPKEQSTTTTTTTTAATSGIPSGHQQRKWLLRLSSSEMDATGTGVCVQFTQDWVYHAAARDGQDSTSTSSSCSTISTNVTVYALPASSRQLGQMPLTLPLYQWSLVGITHTFPYLKRPQFTIAVNGLVQGTMELAYPNMETMPTSSSSSSSSKKNAPAIMQHCTLLHNIGLCKIQIPKEQSSSTKRKKQKEKGDDVKSASELNQGGSVAANTTRPLVLHFASCALHADCIVPELQALLYTTGPALSLQQLGKIVTPLPPVDNWTKGTSWEGPNVGIPLAVHYQYSLDLQHLSGRVMHAFGATHAKVLRGRITLAQPYCPGATDSTPKVGLVQPAVPQREELPSLHIFSGSGSAVGTDAGGSGKSDGGVHVVHALSEFLLRCDNGNVDPHLYSCAKHLSVVLLEQGLLPAIIMPFFLALLPAGYGLELQQPLYTQSLKYVYDLYKDGEWAAQLLLLLCDAIQYGGGRTQEQVLQAGMIHVVASCLRKGLLRAETLKVQSFDNVDDFCKNALQEQAWFRPTHDQACPSYIPKPILLACSKLVAVCCGTKMEVMEFTPSTKLQRASDLGLTAVFGLALNFDLFGTDDTVLSQVAWRYGNVQGGQILRKQVPVQTILDAFRVRAEIIKPKPTTATTTTTMTNQQTTNNNNNSSQNHLALYLAQIIQHMLLASLTHPKNVAMSENDLAACLGALSDCPLGSVGAHVVLSSLTNILEWCHSANSTDEYLLHNLATRLGRNLLMGQFHDVLAPMLLSRTIFCGTNSNMSTMSTNTSTGDGSGESGDGSDNDFDNGRTSWQAHWRMTLTLFAWVTSTSGPEGSVAAQSTGSLLLASGLAGSLNGVLVDESASEAVNRRFIANLFLPPPTMALMVGQQKEFATSWNYTDILSDRLKVMVPLLPGMVVSLVWDVNEARLSALQEMVSAVGGAFHRVFGHLIQSSSSSSSSSSTRKGRSSTTAAQRIQMLRAAQDHVPHLVLVVVWLEHAIQSRLETNHTDNTPTVVLKAAPPKTPDDRQRSDSQGSWVEVSSNAFADTDNIGLEAVVTKQDMELKNKQEGEKETVQLLCQSQKAILSTLTELLSNAMRMGGGETATMVLKCVLKALQDAVVFCDAKNHAVKSMAHDILCRLVAIILTKLLTREYEWEMWTLELCGAVARMCNLVEEKELLVKPRGPKGTYTRDQVILLHCILQVMEYGREMTGWCQLVLPTPPDMAPTQAPPPKLSVGDMSIEEHMMDIIDKTDQLVQSVTSSATNIVLSPSSPDADIGTINTDILDAGRHYVPPEAPGASSKLLLPILQPCLRIVLATMGCIGNETQIKVPQHISVTPTKTVSKEIEEAGKEESVNVEDETEKQTPPSMVVKVSDPVRFVDITAEELKQTMVAAIVGLSFPNARDVALDGVAWLRRILDDRASPLQNLFGDIVEEIRVRYEGERRRREQALFDAYDDGEEAESSREVERMILGGDLIPGGKNNPSVMGEPMEQKESVEEITFSTTDLEADEIIVKEPSQQDTQLPPPEMGGSGRGSEDFVMFHEAYNEPGEGTRLGWDHYKGLGSTLEECGKLLKPEDGEDVVENLKTPQEQVKMLIKLLAPYIDAWDARIAQEAADSELVELFGSVGVNSGDDGENTDHAVVKASQTAADAMSTFIEMASVEKSRLTEVTHSYSPSIRHSMQAYAERYCWAKYFEAVDNNAAVCGMHQLWERGVGDGNRDIRSRLITMPCNPQFKRFIPRHLDLSQDIEQEPMPDNQTTLEAEQKEEETNNNDGPMSEEDMMQTLKNVVEAGKLEIVDITKKEVQEDEMPELLTTENVDDLSEADDDVYGDGSLGFPSRDDESQDTSKESATDASTTGSTDSEPSSSLSHRMVDKGVASRHHQIVSSIFAHPPDNSSSTMTLMRAAIPGLIEKHFDNCLHVKAEGSRKCTLLLSPTHLIIEYDADAEGLFEGEMMAVREEAERQRLIEEAGGPSASAESGEKASKIHEELERRQKEMACLRPRSIRWNLSELSHVYLRRYRLRDSALEMFFIPSGGTSYGGFGMFSPATSLFVDFGSGHDGNRRRDDAAHAIMRRSPPQTIKQWPDKSGQFLHEQLSRLTMGWVEGRITNFDYLLHLNMLAGRSYNDLCQYPVMPWVLSDYASEEIPDLTDRSKFRDLSKPMGAINENRLRDFLERFETFADPTIPPFMYGSHYSTSAGVVLHFLVRLHPFAGLHRQLQGGHFDVADRLFSSIPRTWDMCTGYSAAEVKELTPEWYCNPAFLKNTNNFKLGTSQDGELLGDVVLPPWAGGSAEKFIEVMRNALESDICSEMLPDWIDLIFGRKQQGPEAIKAHNVFFYLTYYGSVDVASIEDEGLRQATELQIAHFGQCPMQLFVRPHVRRAQKIINYRKLTFYQLLSAYSQGADREEDGSHRQVDRLRDGSQRLFGEPLFLPFFSAPLSHWIHLDAPPPGPHAPLISVRLAGIDRCLAVDGNGIFHSFRWAWKPDPPNDKEDDGNSGAIDRGNFVAQRELPRFKSVPRLLHVPSKREDSIPAVAISKTLFASRSVLLVLSDGDGRGGLAMQLVDPAKGSVKGEAVVPGVHSARISCVVMDPIGTAAGHGGVGGELAIIGSEDGGASMWRFMSSHYLPLRPRIRMRGHGGSKIQSVALSSAIHICATVSAQRCCIFSIGNGALIHSFPPPQDTLSLPASAKTTTKTVFCDTPAMCLSVQGFIVTVCRTTIFNEGTAIRDVITLHLFSLEGVSLGSKALESWRGVPHKITATPDGTAITVCSGRGVTIHRLSAITPLEFVDEWHITETDELNDRVPTAFDVDFGPSLMRPIVAAAACTGGVLRLHALPGISPWSERHKKSTMNIGSAFSKPVGRIRNAVGKSLGFGKTVVGVGKEITKEVSSDVKERGVGGFLAGTLFRKKG